MVLALGLLRAACNRPGEWVPLIDHEPGLRIVRERLYEIAVTAGAMKQFEWLEDSSPRCFRMTAPVSEEARQYIFEGFTVEENIAQDIQVTPVPEPSVAPVIPAPKPKPKRPSMREVLVAYVTAHPGQTATQIAQGLNRKSVSAALAKVTKMKQLRREGGIGPRGGCVYFALPRPDAGETCWDKILKQEATE